MLMIKMHVLQMLTTCMDVLCEIGLFSPEDWQCMMCGNINWAKRSECNVCNHPKEGKIEQREGYLHHDATNTS